MRVAIVGSGIAGLVSAHFLQHSHDVVLFEASSRPGGHTNTVRVDHDRDSFDVDTGFIVFNERTYPNFMRLMQDLGIPWCNSEMSFSVRSNARDFEYNGHNLSSLFAQRQHLLSPRFHRMVWDILRFYRQAGSLLSEGVEIPLIDWLRERRYSRAFIEDHLLPMVRAVWSTRSDVANRFPARFLTQFFHNHGFLRLSDQPQWLTIPGGARQYVDRILTRLRGEVRLGAPVYRIRRDAEGVALKSKGAEPERFDHVVLACHSDQALRMLEDPSDLESQTLSAIPYQRNEALLHTDTQVMPRLPRSWASWNVHLDDQGVDGACISYWMNRLQPLPSRHQYFVTLNNSQAVREDTTLRSMVYHHPLFTPAGIEAQARHTDLIDTRSTSYCGAYWRNGFHEDGVVSALRVCRRLGVPAWN